MIFFFLFRGERFLGGNDFWASEQKKVYFGLSNLREVIFCGKERTMDYLFSEALHPPGQGPKTHSEELASQPTIKKR